MYVLRASYLISYSEDHPQLWSMDFVTGSVWQVALGLIPESLTTWFTLSDVSPSRGAKAKARSAGEWE